MTTHALNQRLSDVERIFLEALKVTVSEDNYSIGLDSCEKYLSKNKFRIYKKDFLDGSSSFYANGRPLFDYIPRVIIYPEVICDTLDQLEKGCGESHDKDVKQENKEINDNASRYNQELKDAYKQKPKSNQSYFNNSKPQKSTDSFPWLAKLKSFKWGKSLKQTSTSIDETVEYKKLPQPKKHNNIHIDDKYVIPQTIRTELASLLQRQINKINSADGWFLVKDQDKIKALEELMIDINGSRNSLEYLLSEVDSWLTKHKKTIESPRGLVRFLGTKAPIKTPTKTSAIIEDIKTTLGNNL